MRAYFVLCHSEGEREGGGVKGDCEGGRGGEVGVRGPWQPTAYSLLGEAGRLLVSSSARS